MSYESPIEIVCGEMKNQLENDVYSVVQSYGIKIDKEELIKALEYDRNQYQQGYTDAKEEFERKKGKWIEDETGYGFWTCSVCGFVSEAFGADILYHYCPSCGAYLKGDK